MEKNLEDITLKELMEILENDKDTLVEVLLNYKDKWNKLMQENKTLNNRILISGIVLKNKDLSGLDLSDTEIEDSDFSESDLSNSTLSNSSVIYSNFSGTNFYQAQVNSMRMSQSNLSSARMYSVSGLNQAYFTGSVNLFSTYLSQEEKYHTSPEVTMRGFSQAEAYEHAMEDHDNEDYNSYY
jgi:uncharacterized protein YjbI with pentapeptide repeats